MRYQKRDFATNIQTLPGSLTARPRKLAVSQKEKLFFQPAFFGGELLNFTRWWFLFSALLGEDSHFDSYFSIGLKAPTSLRVYLRRCHLDMLDRWTFPKKARCHRKHPTKTHFFRTYGLGYPLDMSSYP